MTEPTKEELARAKAAAEMYHSGVTDVPEHAMNLARCYIWAEEHLAMARERLGPAGMAVLTDARKYREAAARIALLESLGAEQYSGRLAALERVAEAAQTACARSLRERGYPPPDQPEYVALVESLAELDALEHKQK